ncbi:hypothetical protein B0H11DRAFT_2322024 [Mycena galericulata]|nr:hypothetical protein B0H11DRAFT_2322024 [Mycena galericulata]
MPLSDADRRPQGALCILSDVSDFNKNWDVFTEGRSSPAGTSSLLPVTEVEVQQIYEAVRETVPWDVCARRTPSLFIVHTRFHSIILRWQYRSPAEVLVGFDVDAGSRVHANPWAIVSMMRQCNTTNETRRSSSYEFSLSKIKFFGANALMFAIHLKCDTELVDFLLANRSRQSLLVPMGTHLTMNHEELLQHPLNKLPHDVAETLLCHEGKDRMKTLLHFTVERGSATIVGTVLVFSTASLRIRDADRFTSLHIAVEMGRLQIIEHLVDATPADLAILERRRAYAARDGGPTGAHLADAQVQNPGHGKRFARLVGHRPHELPSVHDILALGETFARLVPVRTTTSIRGGEFGAYWPWDFFRQRPQRIGG